VTVGSVVFDASVIVRAGVDQSPQARSWTRRLDEEIYGYAPDLLWLEVASALRRYVGTGSMTLKQAHTVLAYASGLRLENQPLRGLAAPALDSAVVHGLSVYDACYVVLADALDATLVTADRNLAAAAGRAELIA
jgi:predicted nucleic acid-binding protein